MLKLAEDVRPWLRAPGSGNMPLAGGLVSYLAVSKPDGESAGSSLKSAAKAGDAGDCAAKPVKRLS